MTGASASSRVAAGWMVLTPPSSNAYATFPLRLAPGEGRDLRVSLDRTGRRSLLIPIEGSTPTSAPRTPLLDIHDEHLVLGPDRGRYAVLTCVSDRFWPEFSALCADIGEALSEEQPADYQVAFLSTLARWRELLRTLAKRALSQTEWLGLYGEIAFLNRVAGSRPGTSAEVWQGPMLKPHDFMIGGGSFEVKTLAPSATSVTIHGIDQLTADPGESLHLVLVRVEEDADGEPLAGLISRTRPLLADPAEFDRRLARVGWSTESADGPARVLGVSLFDTAVMTCKLTKAELVAGSLPPGVHDLSYQIATDALLLDQAPLTLDDVLGGGSR